MTSCVGHSGWVWAIAVMPDGQRFLGGSEDSTIRVWLLDGTLKTTFELHDGSVNALVALPNNQHSLSGSHDGRSKSQRRRRRVLHTFNTTSISAPVTVTSLALLPDGLRFVSGERHSARIVYHGLAPH